MFNAIADGDVAALATAWRQQPSVSTSSQRLLALSSAAFKPVSARRRSTVHAVTSNAVVIFLRHDTDI